MTALGDALSRSEGLDRASVATGPPRAIQAAYDALEPAERALLADVLVGTDKTTEWIVEVLSAQGFPISVSTVNTYRRALRREASTV